jgi:5-methylcytosine-specific restriction endonuclease McrA
MSTTVLILNAGYEPMQVVTLRKALTMLHRQVAVVEEAEPDRQVGPFPMPRVLRLLRYISLKWQNRPVGWSRARLMARDRWKCGYCGGPARTVDHVVPVSKGGTSTYANTTAACLTCNGRKADRTPAEAGMRLRVPLKAPTVRDLYEAQGILVR